MPAYDYIGVEHEFRSFLIGEEGDGKAHKVCIEKGAVGNEYLEDEKAHHYFCVSVPVKLVSQEEDGPSGKEEKRRIYEKAHCRTSFFVDTRLRR